MRVAGKEYNVSAVELGSKWFVDARSSDGNAFHISHGPFDTRAEASAAFDTALNSDATATLRLRGPANTIHAESYGGNVVRHDPPRRFTNNKF